MEKYEIKDAIEIADRIRQPANIFTNDIRSAISTLIDAGNELIEKEENELALLSDLYTLQSAVEQLESSIEDLDSTIGNVEDEATSIRSAIEDVSMAVDELK